jgi:hypothetical protein
VLLLGWLALELFMAAWRRSESTPRTYAVALGDLDGDGRLDAFYGNGLQNAPHPNTVMFQQPGQPGVFRDSGQTPGGGRSVEVRLADLDADGDLDAMTTGLPNYSFFFNEGSGGFRADNRWDSGLLGKWSLVPGDLDGDGDLDLLASGCCGPGEMSNYVLINEGGAQGGEAGAFRRNGQNLESLGAQAAALGDLDGDGDLDAFFGNDFATDPVGELIPGRPNTVWWNDGRGGFTDSGQRLGEVQTKGVALGDLDGDGDPDAYIANYGPDEIWLNAGGRQGGEPGQFADSGQRLGVGLSTWVKLADLDGDQDLDAAVITEGTSITCFFSGCTRLVLWLNDGNGSFSKSRQRIAHSKATAYDLGDLDGDGDLDIFAGWYENGYAVWWNDGEGRFSP